MAFSSSSSSPPLLLLILLLAAAATLFDGPLLALPPLRRDLGQQRGEVGRLVSRGGARVDAVERPFVLVLALAVAATVFAVAIVGRRREESPRQRQRRKAARFVLQNDLPRSDQLVRVQHRRARPGKDEQVRNVRVGIDRFTGVSVVVVAAFALALAQRVPPQYLGRLLRRCLEGIDAHVPGERGNYLRPRISSSSRAISVPSRLLQRRLRLPQCTLDLDHVPFDQSTAPHPPVFAVQ
mmetsp:Transcript_25123/g.73640  ORF Transcript_25123/g.73640 Transcript_25123/m.73640 type:complete len:238 (+) Transcript_25123:1024-1737(+)